VLRESKKEKPARALLYQNEPNPFSSVTNIRFSVPTKSRVRLRVYDLGGRLVKTLVDEDKRAGYHQVRWYGRDGSGVKVSKGIYFYRLEVGEFKATRKLILLK
jgi:flagellar hook assembly protein FlgD